MVNIKQISNPGGCGLPNIVLIWKTWVALFCADAVGASVVAADASSKIILIRKGCPNASRYCCRDVGSKIKISEGLPRCQQCRCCCTAIVAM
jgi:hypothetical protein